MESSIQKPIRSDLKVIVIGASGTGKTSFVNKFAKNQFSESYKATIVSEFGFKIVEVNGNRYRVQLWDIAGQDKGGSMTKIFAKDSHGCVILSQVDKPETMEDTIKWKKSVDDSSTFIDGGQIPCILIQNKIDLIEDQSKVEEIKQRMTTFCEKNNFVNGFVTSVKEGINVDESMKYLIDLIVDRLEKYAALGHDVFHNPNARHTIKLESNTHKKESKREDKKDCCK